MVQWTAYTVISRKHLIKGSVKLDSCFSGCRTQQVVVNGESSQYKKVTRVISQGSGLGPFLFVIFMSDLPQKGKSHIFLFVDGSKIFRNIKEPDDQGILYDDVDTMIKWADYWQLEFDSDRCVTKSINKEGSIRTYGMNEVELKQV